MEIYLFRINVVRDNEIWIFVFKNIVMKDFLALQSIGKTVLGLREDGCTTLSYII